MPKVNWDQRAAAELRQRYDAAITDLATARADAEAYRQMVDAIRVRNKELGAECETLRDALTAVQQAFAKGEAQFTKKRQSDSDPYHPANTKMMAALFPEDKGKGV